MSQNFIVKQSKMWNPWHGCHKLSEGCRYCYVYRGDARRGIDSSIVDKTKNFDLPIQKKRNGDYKIAAGTMVYTCFTSDFLLKDADEWRAEAWDMIRMRSDLHFLMITKRIDRLHEVIPQDWGEGYENVTICCTVENQDRADYRLPIYKAAPVKRKIIICEPLLEKIDLQQYEIGLWAEQIVAGGESGRDARICNFDWVMELQRLAVEQNISFWFKQTGAKFIKGEKVYDINRRLQHSQARRAGINFVAK